MIVNYVHAVIHSFIEAMYTFVWIMGTAKIQWTNVKTERKQ